MARYTFKIEAYREGAEFPFLASTRWFEAQSDDGAIAFAISEYKWEKERIDILEDPRHPTETKTILLREVSFP